MRNQVIIRISIIPIMVLIFILVPNASGQDMGTESYSEGYGSHGMMGQNPDEILEYGRKMMRYGFHEGTASGSNKYPGYGRHLDEDTIKKLNAEQKAFIIGTEEIRQAIYEKELYLKAELSKKVPDKNTALDFQKSISDARGKFEQKMIEHLIRMKTINLEAERK